jgi:outer membrane cobalamin receptor
MQTLLCIVLAAIAVSCTGSTQVSRPPADRYVITQQEIEQSRATNAYELIRERRPEFLRPQGPKAFTRGVRSTRMPVVYMDGMLMGETSELTKIPIETINEVRYFNEVDAQQRFGLGNVAGAIEVITKK